MEDTEAVVVEVCSHPLVRRLTLISQGYGGGGGGGYGGGGGGGYGGGGGGGGSYSSYSARLAS